MTKDDPGPACGSGTTGACAMSRKSDAPEYEYCHGRFSAPDNQGNRLSGMAIASAAICQATRRSVADSFTLVATMFPAS
jgi:hypothetical protein